MNTTFSKAIEEIKRGRRFLVISHVNPEGDAVGSLLGLSLALKEAGKDVVAYLEDPVPALFRFLPGSNEVVHSLEGMEPFDATFAVDCGQFGRLGKGFATFKGRGTLINIDHHKTNDHFGDINIIVPEASAAGEIVFDLLKEAGLRITEDVAVNLYVAIHTDTGSFRYSSSTPEAFRKAGELVRLGADPWKIASRVYENHPLKRFRLLQEALSTLEVKDEGRIAVLTITQDMLKRVNGTKDLVDGFVNYARAVEGVEVGVLLRECGRDEYKISLRAKGDVDVSKVAEKFGGGGHPHAAGCNIKGSLEEVKEKIVNELKEAIMGGVH